MKQHILAMCNELDAELKHIRQHLHCHPELSRQEHQTSLYLKNILRANGLQIKESGKTPGFLAILDSQKPGKTIVLRTDIDALPIEESVDNLTQKRAVISQHQGVMHACGHDAHMAMMIGVARILTSLRAQLSGNVIFCFESAEEDSGGWQDIIELLSEFHIDAIYGTHVAAFMESGTFSADAGAVMAGCIITGMEVIGKGGHGSRPDLAINPVFPMAAILNNFAHAYANYKHVDKVVTLGITQLEAAKARNVIADRGLIGGTLRFFDKQEAIRFWEKLKLIAEQTATMHDCQLEIEEEIGDAVMNDSQLSALLQDTIEQLYPGQLRRNVQWYASETFSQYAELAPACFMFLGVANKQTGSGADHHNAQFDIDEDTLKQGTAVMSYCTWRFLTGNSA